MSSGFDQHGFVESWCEEFARAIEMFSGSKAAVVCSQTKSAVKPKVKEYLWWKQQFEGLGAPFVTWIGATAPTWSALGSSMAEDATGAKDIYLELLGQAEQGAATLLSRQAAKEVRCQTGQVEEPPASVRGEAWQVTINTADKELPPILYFIDSSEVEKLAVDAPEERRKTAEVLRDNASEEVRVDQVLNLSLPLSVVLGRSVMQIQDVLKLTSGSVVELDSTVADHVEVLVHGKLVARGEVVSVKGNYGVRITEVVAGAEP